MKKIIAAFDGLKFSQSTLVYATQLASRHKAHLVGVFIEDFTYQSRSLYDTLDEAGFSEKKLQEMVAADRQQRNQAIQLFEEACSNAKLGFSVHRNRNFALQELLQESIYADLLVIDAAETMSRLSEAPPTRFVRDLLSSVQCPVLLVPRHYTPVQRVVLLYDGEPSSVYAIKMFSYLLPEMNALPIEVMTVKPPQEDRHLPDGRLMKEFLKRHYPDARQTVVNGSAESTIPGLLRQHEQPPLIVLGAYRRGMVSRWFRPSMADTLAQELQCPLFIAHNR